MRDLDEKLVEVIDAASEFERGEIVEYLCNRRGRKGFACVRIVRDNRTRLVTERNCFETVERDFK